MNTTNTSEALTGAVIGSISHGTLKPDDLLNAFIHELEWQVRLNGKYFSKPEHFAERDRYTTLIGEAQDCFDDAGGIRDEELAGEIIDSMIDALNEFAGPYRYFGAHEGDGADFGYWPDYSSIDELPAFEDTDAGIAAADGDFKVISDHGNIEIYSQDGVSILGIV